ncbi:RNA 2',3'-cyclic phosphodiesterase [Chloroflexota bacterium]
MEQVRSFIAIELPTELKLGLAQLEAQMKESKQPWVKWVNPNSIHLTLKFLGNIAIDRISEITKAMEEVVQGIPPFYLKISGLGAFPNLIRTQVAWVGISGEIGKLSQLQQHLESNLTRLSFVPESRPFTPHLTLARLRDRVSLDERQRFGQLIASTKFEAAYTINVKTINLIKSQLTREGAIYSKINSVKLKKPF